MLFYEHVNAVAKFGSQTSLAHFVLPSISEAEKSISAERKAGNVGWFQNLANGITTEYLHRNDVARFVQVAAIRSNLTHSFTKSLARR